MSDRAKSWARKTFKNVVFPSGKEADLQRPSLMSMVSQDGTIPNSFFAAMFGDKKKAMPTVDGDKQADYAKTMFYLAKKVAVEAFASPRIILEGEANYDADEIHINDLEDRDQFFLMDWVMGGAEPAEALVRFLEQERTGLATAPQS